MRGWSLSELARRAKIGQTTLSRIMNRHQSPHRATLEKVGDVLGISYEALVDGKRRSRTAVRNDQEMVLDAYRRLAAVQRSATLAFIEAFSATGDIDAAAITAKTVQAIEERRRAKEKDSE